MPHVDAVPLSTAELNKLDATFEKTLETVAGHQELAAEVAKIQHNLATMRLIVTSARVAALPNRAYQAHEVNNGNGKAHSHLD